MTLAEKTDTAELLPETFSRWFASRGWTPRAHQLDLLSRARDGRSVLLIAPTGGGKTLAGFLPTLVELSEQARISPRTRSPSPRTLLAPSPLEGEVDAPTGPALLGRPDDRLRAAGGGCPFISNGLVIPLSPTLPLKGGGCERSSGR